MEPCSHYTIVSAVVVTITWALAGVAVVCATLVHKWRRKS